MRRLPVAATREQGREFTRKADGLGLVTFRDSNIAKGKPIYVKAKWSRLQIDRLLLWCQNNLPAGSFETYTSSSTYRSVGNSDPLAPSYQGEHDAIRVRVSIEEG